MAFHFGLIVIGDEILSGKRADKHMPKVIELLAARGLSLAYAEYVGDDPARITATLERVFAAAGRSSDVVFSTGGIGATPDDHTRQCAAKALGIELALHPEAKILIERRMRDLAKEQGTVYEPDNPDNRHRLNMGVFPLGAEIIPNPYNQIPGFSCRAGQGAIHFVPGFPVMAWPMIEWVLDHQYADQHRKSATLEKSIIVLGAMEAMLTPLMLLIEAAHAGVKVFSLPSVDHPQFGRHIELGVKGAPDAVNQAYPDLLKGLHRFNIQFGPELVR